MVMVLDAVMVCNGCSDGMEMSVIGWRTCIYHENECFPDIGDGTDWMIWMIWVGMRESGEIHFYEDDNV